MYQRIRDLREDRDLLQKDVAAYLKCTQVCYSNYETGKRDIPTEVLIQLAGLYHTSTDYILGLTDDSAPPISRNHHNRKEIIKSICPSKQLQSLQKSEETYHSIPSINTPIKALYNPIITHPEERIWAGRKPRVPDAPKIKHDKMKQFYMVDMGRKM